MSKATPLDSDKRRQNYLRQTGRRSLTERQYRRLLKKDRRTPRRAEL